jgi:hypothetical protein
MPRPEGFAFYVQGPGDAIANRSAARHVAAAADSVVCDGQVEDQAPAARCVVQVVGTVMGPVRNPVL